MTDCTVIASFKVKEITITVTAGYEVDTSYDGKYPKPGGGYYAMMYNICMYVTASGPADKDYFIGKTIHFVNPVSESNPNDGPEEKYEAEITLKKGETSAKAIAYQQPYIPNKIWVGN